MKKLVIYMYLIVICALILGRVFDLYPKEDYQAIKSLIMKYKRPITVLEISVDFPKYSFEIAKKFDAICVILLLQGDAQKVINEIKLHNYKNIILLTEQMSLKYFEVLGRCEYFDVTIAHDFSKLYGDSWKKIAKLLMKLGDYIFLENHSAIDQLLPELNDKSIMQIVSGSNETLSLYKTEKKGLELARFTQYKRNKPHVIKYRIKSDFEKKLFCRNSQNSLPMIPGINLITFVMLRGLYPTDNIISRSIKKMKNAIPYHDDLVIGNMIVKGCNIIPIDFNDNGKYDMTECINLALKFFNGTNQRLINPYKYIKKYYPKQ